ncbi:MAG: HDIG domain-containing protein [Verrucomicrobia bacterium]|nr:HDIG domain-containing protein [Verrucomicrobiota bacterium]MCH8511347.1 HDIG domain-containing protein [Kiritimatiellia bacterium]
MTDQKSLVSKSRQKRTQERTRNLARNPRVITLKLVLITVVMWKVLMAVLHLGGNPVITELTPGQTAPFTVQAEIDFETINLDQTEVRRERAMNESPPVLSLQTTRLREARRNFERFQDRAEASRLSPENDLSATVDLLNLPAILGEFPEKFSPELSLEIRQSLLNKLQKLWERGMIAPADRETGYQGFVTGTRVQIGLGGPIRELGELPTPVEAAEAAAKTLTEKHELNHEQSQMVGALLAALLEANLNVDAQSTRQARALAGQNVDPVYETRTQGETLMEARSRVTEQIIRDVQTHAQILQEMAQTDPNRARMVSHGIFLALGLIMSVMLMVLLQREQSANTYRLILWGVLTLISLLMSQAVIYLTVNMNLIPGFMVRPLLPLALAPLLATILYGPAFALAVGVSSSLVVALSQDFDLLVFFCGLMITLTAAIGLRSIHKRSNLFRAGLWIGGVKALVMIATAISEQVTPLVLSQMAVGAFATGLISAVLVLLVIPPFEFFFKVTTDVRLLELSDMGHPLLARLAMEAPGTYHHSLMVSHLAQTAARDIGANDLLVRVCAYYHDIGKLTKPEFFIENIQGRRNPHDELSPSMSRLIVISHVKEGVSLAHRYKLPRIIIEGIEQHHGTSIIQYFYYRARTRAEGDAGKKEKVDKDDYRYPGPRPKTREMGILLIADAIEAASRSIDKNKPGQIEGLVNEIIKEKLMDGQFDLCGLTMSDITAIRRSMIFSLNNMLHGRVAYPKDTDAEAIKEATKDMKKDAAKEAAKDSPKDTSSEAPHQTSGETPKETAGEAAKNIRKEKAGESGKKETADD